MRRTRCRARLKLHESLKKMFFQKSVCFKHSSGPIKERSGVTGRRRWRWERSEQDIVK